MAKTSDFMFELEKRLLERGLSEKTAKYYVQMLYTLHEKMPFTSLAFLRNTEGIAQKVGEYAPTTQKTIYGILTSVLDDMKTKSPYKKAFTFYAGQMKDKKEELEKIKADSNGEKTAKQAEAWIDWDDVLKKTDDMRVEVSRFASNKTLTPAQYEKLLNLVVLAVYTYLPPRRNEYTNMFVVGQEPTDKSRNYYVYPKHQFVFHNYKTVRTYGSQTIDVPDSPDRPLVTVLDMYLKHHPLMKGKPVGKKTDVPLLVKQDGTPLHPQNGITRRLNMMFAPKKVGSSLLRHAFLSSRYAGLKDGLEQDTAQMANSPQTALREYVLKD